LHSCPAVDQEKFFSSDQKGNPQIVLGRFASAHFIKNFLRDGEERVVAAGLVVNGGNLSDPFRARNGGIRSLVVFGRSNRRLDMWLNLFYGGDETIAAARKRLNETRLLVRIAKRAAQSLNRRVHAMLEIDEGIGGPKTFLQILSSEEFARVLQQQSENLEGPTGETDLATVFAQFASAKINVVGIEAKATFMQKLVGHWGKLGNGVYPEVGRNSSSTGTKRRKYLPFITLRLYLPCIYKGLPMH